MRLISSTVACVCEMCANFRICTQGFLSLVTREHGMLYAVCNFAKGGGGGGGGEAPARFIMRNLRPFYTRGSETIHVDCRR